MASYEKFSGNKLSPGINFCGEPLSEDFTGIKKGENLNLWEETFVFIVLC